MAEDGFASPQDHRVPSVYLMYFGGSWMGTVRLI